MKTDASGRLLNPEERLRFPVKAIRSGQYLNIKRRYRRGEDSSGRQQGPGICTKKGLCLKDILDGRSAAKFKIEDLLDTREFQSTSGRILQRLEEMQAKNLMRAQLSQTPWSDSYWPIADGILGNRYASPAFQGGGSTWKDLYTFIHRNRQTLADVYGRGNPQEIDELSPSEKYDLLIGSLDYRSRNFPNGYLTPRMWEEGKRYWDQYGNVEPWMGICHGWAPASFMIPRPERAIQVLAADGKTELKFYPSDLKGLISYIWANSSPATRFLGGRCDDKNVRRDEETGRILDERCFDTNPANWHLAIINQIGIAKRSIVMDAAFDYEVWNQPIYSYDYTYFNPQTGQETKSLKDAMVAPESFTQDKFKRFRSKETAAIVGISMSVDYIVETQPSHEEVDQPENDVTNTVHYMYDLEIDENGRVIGGEWYSNLHPDFLWLPEVDGHAQAPGDERLDDRPGAWTTDDVLPKFWSDMAIASATRAGTPLAGIIERMIDASHSSNNSERGPGRRRDHR